MYSLYWEKNEKEDFHMFDMNSAYTKFARMPVPVGEYDVSYHVPLLY